MNDSPSLTASALCTQCGLCCDGTLYERARVLPGDDYVYPEIFTIVYGPKGKNFILPCLLLRDRVCPIYQQRRPLVCGNYKCRLLKRFEEGGIPFVEAMQVVVQAREHATRVRAGLSAVTGESDAPLRRLYRRMKELFAVAPETVPLSLDFVALQMRLDKHFRHKPLLKEEIIPPETSCGTFED